MTDAVVFFFIILLKLKVKTEVLVAFGTDYQAE